jgi:hypothetical protein
MRSACTFALLAIAAVVLAACTSLHVAGAPVFGGIHDLPRSDIEAAVVAYQKLHLHTVGTIQIVSRDEIRIHWKDAKWNYDIMERVRGLWVYTGATVIVA